MKRLFAAASLVLFSGIATAEPVPQRTGLPVGQIDPLDDIMARRNVMTAINRMNDELHDIIDGVVEWDERGAKTRLDMISTFLLATPAMFTEGSYIYSREAEEEEPALVTKATPAVWEDWDSFVMSSLDAAEIAFRAAGAKTREELTELTLELEARCNSCHEMYRDDADYITPESLGLFPPGEPK